MTHPNSLIVVFAKIYKAVKYLNFLNKMMKIFAITIRKMDSTRTVHKSSSIKMILLLSISLLILVSIKSTKSQIVSPELRRLAASTNQFGIDSLRALDRIEPPDRVLVFCPVCLSSSLTMILMGSSKYQVVSSMRHALYIWSMKPQEVNKGFKDIFEHIGLNQSPSTTRSNLSTASSPQIESHKYHRHLDNVNNGPQLNYDNEWVRVKRSPSHRNFDYVSIPQRQQLSLPKLIQMKEYLERRKSPWWSTIGKESSHESRKQTFRHRIDDNIPLKTNSTPDLVGLEQNESIDSSQLSQMSATSNIYIQRGLIINYNYNLLLRDYYRTVIHPVDFNRHSEETRQHMNSIVASSTEGKIKELVRRGTSEYSNNTKAMIISTFHFRGTLDLQMKLKDSATNKSTNNGRQGRASGYEARNAANQTARSQPFIETEEALMKYGYFGDLDSTMIEIPFNSRLISLIILMPSHKNSTELVMTRLSAQLLTDMIASLNVKKISIEIPVIKFDRGPVNVNGLLTELGLGNFFFGDKIYSTETGLNRWMKPYDIIHETSIDIGTINPKWGQPEDRLKIGAHDDKARRSRNKDDSRHDNHIILDKSFLYFVYDSINGLVLTMGRIRQ